jgi:hypothetical protein
MDIGAGDWVECVSFQGIMVCGNSESNAPSLIVGRIYQVEEVFPPSRFADGESGISVQEVKDIDENGNRWAFCLECFRPIYRPKSSLIESIKTPSRIRERA